MYQSIRDRKAAVRKSAFKAWKTRRRLATPTPHMKRVLEFLVSSPTARVSAHYNGDTMYYVSLSQVNPDGSEAGLDLGVESRVDRRTFKGMERRGWLTFERRRDNGGIMGILPDGTRGIVTPSYNLDYTISDKGRKVKL